MTAWVRGGPSPPSSDGGTVPLHLGGRQPEPAAAKNKDMVYVLTAKCFFLLLLLLLCHIAVLVRRGLASLYVLLVDKHFDALLYHADTGIEPGFGLVDHLEEKKKKG